MKRSFAFLLLGALAALAACAQQGSLPPGTSPASPQAVAFDATAHAPCTIAPGLSSPVHGPMVIATAYGELLETSGAVRYAYAGIALTYAPGRPVYAAFEGRARYVSDAHGFGPSIIVTGKTGAQALYASFGRPIDKLLRGAVHVNAGERIATSGRSHLRFFYAPAGDVTAAGTQRNPCGTGGSDGAAATISVMPENVAVTARFHTLSVDGTPLPLGQYPTPPGIPDVSTPENLSGSAATAHAIAPTVYERSDTFASFYVVLCGNAVFARGHARYAGPFPYPNPTASSTPPAVTPALPPVVFFRDAGKYGAELTAPLPAPYQRGCPAPPPANVYVFGAPVFGQPGQTKYVYYWLNPPSGSPSPAPTGSDSVTFSGFDAAVVTIDGASTSPSPLPVSSTQPPAWPPPSPRGEIRAAGTGTTTILVQDAFCGCADSPIVVTVQPTPTVAPVPTPLPNT